MAAYHSIYQPLGKNHIRLMRMDHSSHGLIKCELDTFTLRDNPVYNALSYCWTKKAIPSYEICVNGQKLEVRSSLFEYLKIMRDEQHDQWIFIDAICINQEDVIERGQQVTLMPQVYRGAEEVIAWLNTPCPNLAKDCSDAEADPFCDLDSMGSLLQFCCDHEDALSKVLDSEEFPIPRMILLRAVSTDIVDAEFWTRTWIVQEVVLAQVLTIRTHWLRIPSEQLHTMLQYFEWNSTHSPSSSLYWTGLSLRRYGYLKDGDLRDAAFTLVSHLMSARHGDNIVEKGAFPYKPLAEALIAYSGQTCSRPFDKVFGLLGMVDSQIQPDYEMSPLELFLRTFIEAVIEQARYYEMRNLMGQTEQSKSTHVVIEEALLCAQLLDQLQLDICDPVVLLVLEATLQACHQRFASFEIDIRTIQYQSLIYSPLHRKSSWMALPLNTIWRYTRTVVNIFRVALASWRSARAKVRRKTLLSSPYDNAAAKPAAAWEEWARGLVHEITDRGIYILEKRRSEEQTIFEEQTSRILSRLSKAATADAVACAALVKAKCNMFDRMQQAKKRFFDKRYSLDRGAWYMGELKVYTRYTLELRAINKMFEKKARKRAQERLRTLLWSVTYGKGLLLATSFSVFVFELSKLYIDWPQEASLSDNEYAEFESSMISLD